MDKLTIINRALSETGNNLLSMLADPDFPDEWSAANRAFERRIDDLASRHAWPFGRKRAALVLASTDTTERLPYAFPQPTDCLHLRGVASGTSMLLDGWELRGTTIRSLQQSDLYAVYNTAPADAAWHPQAAEILTIFMESSLLRALNEDLTGAERREAFAEERLREARATVGQQNPARNAYRSSISVARRTRRG